MIKEYQYQNGDMGPSWLHAPSQEQLTTIQEKDTTEWIIEHEIEAEAPSLNLRDQDRLQ